MSHLLDVESLTKSFAGVDALRGISFAVARGEVVALIGPNGAGKTTCFNVIHGEVAADAGNVRFDGRSTLGMPVHAIARLGIGRTFQLAATFASMRVRESIALAFAARAGHDGRALSGPLSTHSADCEALLARLGIAGLAEAHCAALAYGDAKRLELAMALAGSPKLLLMDEPTAGMTPRARRELMDLVIDLARIDRLTIVFTEHDMDIVFAYAERIVVLDRGAVLADGTPEVIRAHRGVQDVYLGTS